MKKKNELNKHFSYLFHSKFLHSHRYDIRRWAHCQWKCKSHHVDMDRVFHRRPSCLLTPCFANSATGTRTKFFRPILHAHKAIMYGVMNLPFPSYSSQPLKPPSSRKIQNLSHATIYNKLDIKYYHYTCIFIAH